MTSKTAFRALRIGSLLAPLALVACGGSDDPSPCNNVNRSFCIATPTTTATTTATAAALYSTSPGSVTLNAGSSATYSIGGGVPPYTATSGNTNVATVSVSGTTLTVNSVAAGTSPLVVVDAVGKAITINVTTLAQGQVGTPLAIAPGSITTGDCTTNIPFFFSGGVAPYRLFTSDNLHVPVSSAQSSAGRPYFAASVQYNGSSLPGNPATLTVLDSQSRTATANIAVTTTQTCATNPLLQAFPETASMRVTEILGFQLSGGAATATSHNFSFTDNDSGTRTTTSTVVEVVPGTNGAKSFNVRALATGKTMVTVNDPVDGQNINITIAVF